MTVLADLTRAQESALRALLRTPPGSWPETAQARRRLVDALPAPRSAAHDTADALVDEAVRTDGYEVHPDRRPKRGRPPIEDEPRAVDHRVRCTRSARDRWRLAADAEGVSLADVTRDLLDEWSERVLS